MKIYEQALTATTSMPRYADLVHRHYADLGLESGDVHLHAIRDSTSASAASVAGRAVNYAGLHLLQEAAIVRRCLSEVSQVYDGVTIGAIQDPALNELRGLLNIPVVGYGESSMLMAQTMGERFAVIAINPVIGSLIRDQVHLRGYSTRFAGMAEIGCGYGELAEAVGGQSSDFDDAVDSAIRYAVEKLGADVIVSGQTIIGDLLWQRGVSTLHGAVIVDSRRAMISTLQFLIGMRSVGAHKALFGYRSAIPPTDLVSDLDSYLSEPF